MEDIGFGNINTPVILQNLFQMTSACDRSVGKRKLFAVHAVWYLCQCQKDRSSDEMVNWIIHSSGLGKAKPKIPDYALDMYTAEGQKKGRERKYFFDEASRTAPELPVRDKTYLKRIIKMLDEGELAD